MTPTQQEELNKARAQDLIKRYKRITATIGRIKRDYGFLLKETADFAKLYRTIHEDHKARMGWWLNTFCPGADHATIKRWMSVANRMEDVKEIPQSWQLKLFGLMTTVHHKNRVAKKTTKKKEKSFVFYLGKGHNLLCKQIEQMGGVEALDEDQREALLQQFGPTAELLRRIK